MTPPEQDSSLGAGNSAPPDHLERDLAELALEPDDPPPAVIDALRAQLAQSLEKPPAAVHDPHADVLRGVTGTRRNTS